MSAKPMNSARKACCNPLTPSNQIAMPAPSASRIATTASASAPASVDSAGTISSAPERTMMTATNVAASEKYATRRAQMASRDTGSSAIRRRAIVVHLRAVGARTAPCRRRAANVLQRAPLRRVEQRRGRARDGDRVDGADPVLGFGMVEQQFQALLLVGHQARQYSRK